MNKEMEDWKNTTYAKGISRFPERKPHFETVSGAPVEPLYGEDPAFNPVESLGFPGEYPYTRGIQPTMYRGRLWTMRQYAGFGTAEDSNARYKYLLSQGQTGLSIAFDLPTQLGYDSDHAISLGEVGKVGVAVDSLADMEILFDGIPLDKVSTSMTINAPASVLLAMYAALARRQNVPTDKINGTIQNDILKEYIARGTYIFPPGPSLRLITDIFGWCAENAPRFNTISISGYHIREAGATAAQEVGFTLADGISYVEAAIKAGLDVNSFGARLSFFFNAYTDLLEEVAKFRAARRLWARIMKNRFNTSNPKASMLRFHTQTAGSSLTAQQPDNNIVRVAIQTLAAIMGGTQSLHTNSRDEALGLPTEDSVRIALRTQQIVAHESGVADTIDPLGGAWYVENATDRIEQEATEIIEKIDNLGGMAAAIEKGYVQKSIQDSAYRYQKKVETGEQIVVGLNKFQVDSETPSEILKVDPSVAETQKAKLKRLREQRDENACQAALQNIKSTAQGTDNLMPAIVDGVDKYCTLGEICGVLRQVFGEHKEQIVL